MLRRAGLLDESHAAMNLDAERRDLDADIGRERLGDRRQQRRALVRRLPARVLVVVAMRTVERFRGHVADRARGCGERLHGEKIALHVRVLDDRAHAVGGDPGARPCRRSCA